MSSLLVWCLKCLKYWHLNANIRNFSVLNAKSVLWNFLKVECHFWHLNAIIWHIKCWCLVFMNLTPGYSFINFIYIVGSLSDPIVVLGEIPKGVGWDKWRDKLLFIWVLWVASKFVLKKKLRNKYYKTFPKLHPTKG